MSSIHLTTYFYIKLIYIHVYATYRITNFKNFVETTLVNNEIFFFSTHFLDTSCHVFFQQIFETVLFLYYLLFGDYIFTKKIVYGLICIFFSALILFGLPFNAYFLKSYNSF